jgi:hypothetical protein
MTGLVWTNGLPLAALPALLFSRRARRAVHGMVRLRRAYEYVVVAAVLEGAGGAHGPYYDGYVAAMQILSARAALIARAL